MQRDLVILSSSPVAHGSGDRNASTFTVPSSSQVDAAGNLLARPLPPGLRSGSRASPIPERAAFGFQSALSLPNADLTVAIDAVEKETVKPARKPRATAAAPRKSKAAAKDDGQRTENPRDITAEGDETVKKKRGRPRKSDGAPPKPRKPRAKRVTGAASAFFDEKENNTKDYTSIDLTVDTPPKRKKYWTPPREARRAVESFASLADQLSEFVHMDSDPAQALKKDAVVLKRKRLDMIDTNEIAQPGKDLRGRSKSPRKQSPTKKHKTITAASLERYDPTEVSDIPKDPISLQTALAPSKASRAKRKAPAGKIPKNQPFPKLLSPASAALRCERQNVMFGTSSQLAGPDSPTYIRQLQQALTASAKLHTDTSARPRKYKTAGIGKSGSMWGAGILHSDDAVLEMSKSEEWKDIDALNTKPPSPATHSMGAKASEWRDIDEDLVTLPENPSEEWRHIDEAKPPSMAPPQQNREISTVLPPTLAQPPISPIKRPRGRPPKDPTASASMKPKAASKRKAKPSKQVPPKQVSSTQPLSSDFIDIDEIQDSDPEPSPSPPRLVRSATSPLTLTSATQVPAKTTKAARYGSRADWNTIKDALFTKITDAVTSTPRSELAGQPTWYERMLTYEPIVLEDFTAWLNEQDVVIAQDDGKVDPILPWMAQKWCEEKSVCCLWKLNNRRVARPTT
jgi:structure-specific endonuclease subunit SLX1-like protein